MPDINDLLIRIDASTEQLRRELKRAETSVDQATGKIDSSLAKVDAKFVAIAKTAAKAGAAMAAAALAIGGAKLVQVARETDVLDAQLKTATGSAEAAAQAFAMLEDIAAQTPYSLDQVVTAFVKLKNLGLDPSREAILSYGNTASAMGKSLDQMIEAVADASTGEFERLKEFGIRAKKQGDTVSLTFRGVTETVGNSAAEIEGYLRRLGDVEFAGAMAERAASLDGALSNLGDSWDALFRTVGRGQIGQAIEDHVRKGIAALERLDGMVARLQGTATPEQELSGQLDDLFVRRQALERQLSGLDDRETPYLEGLRAQLEAVKDQIDGTREALNYFKSQSGMGVVAPGARGGSIEEIEITAKRKKVPKKKAYSDGGLFERNMDEEAAMLKGWADADAEVRSFHQSTRNEVEQIEAQIARVQELASQGFFRDAGIDDQRVLERLDAQLAELGQNEAAIKIMDQLRSNIGGAIDEMFASGEISAEEFFESILRDIARVATQLLLIQPLMDGLFGQAGTSGGGALGGMLGSIFGSIPGFATGGSFRVNGAGAPDSKLVAMRLTPGELVHVTPPGRGSGGGVNIVVNDYGRSESDPPVDVREFMMNGQQMIEVTVQRAVSKMFANGAMDRNFAAASIPVRRNGSR